MAYDPTEGETEERERFLNELDRVLDRIGNGYKLCVLGDLNGWIGYRLRVGITSAFGVSGDNDNGRRVINFCTERGFIQGWQEEKMAWR